MDLQTFTHNWRKQNGLSLETKVHKITTKVAEQPIDEDTPVVFIDLKLANGKTEYVRLAHINDYYRGILAARKEYSLQKYVEIGLYVYDLPTEEQLELELAKANTNSLEFKNGINFVKNLYFK